ncbi:MAG: DUF2258 domain-containing protein [Candidatus Aenigmarchaeota archaeon]|nr:DUF2258 domain-containing protein [Candidatus Aenigmarchaeota archaeon]MDW8159962.1 DUF2258 domain-containing protein [Candidatus Aenigmarchaeota archaeon]
MAVLSTGFVIVGAYAKKIRKTLFAQFKDKIKDKEIVGKLAYASAQLNKVIFEIVVNKLRLEKGDLVKIMIEYDFDENKKEIVWKFDKLKIFSFRRVPQEEIEKVVEEVVEKLKEIKLYEVEKLGETVDEDLIFSVLKEGKEVGIIVTTKLDENSYLLKKVVVVDENPFEIEKVKIEVDGSLKECLSNIVNLETSLRKNISKEDAKKLLEQLKKKLE